MIYPPEFEAFWQARPRRDGEDPKRPAFKEWERCLAEGCTPSEILHGAKCAAQKYDVLSDRRFVPHMRTWLHQRRFEEYEDVQIIEYRELTAEEKWAWRTSTGHLCRTPEKARVDKDCYPPGHERRNEGMV